MDKPLFAIILIASAAYGVSIHDLHEGQEYFKCCPRMLASFKILLKCIRKFCDISDGFYSRLYYGLYKEFEESFHIRTWCVRERQIRTAYLKCLTMIYGEKTYQCGEYVKDKVP